MRIRVSEEQTIRREHRRAKQSINTPSYLPPETPKIEYACTRHRFVHRPCCECASSNALFVFEQESCSEFESGFSYPDLV